MGFLFLFRLEPYAGDYFYIYTVRKERCDSCYSIFGFRRG